MSSYNLKPETQSFIDKEHSAFIHGNYKSGGNAPVFELFNPSDGLAFAKCRTTGAALVGEAVKSSLSTFRSDAWQNLSASHREKMIRRLAELLKEHLDILAEIISMENGKLIAQSKSEIAGAISTFRYYAGWCTKIEGETLDLSLPQKPGKKNFAFTKREPVGVVAAIVPWNFPISIASWKLAPAIAAGCTVVLKPSEITPLSALYLAELFKKAGFPDGVLNVVPGAAETGSALTSHPDIAKITFTGSTAVGRIIGKTAMDNLTDISLELGGKSPAIVFADSNPEEAVKGVAMGIFRNSGQVCVAGSRAYVQRKIYKEFLELIAREAKDMKVSHAFDPEAEIGPIASRSQLEKVCSYIEKGKATARLAFGGGSPQKQGYYLEPTIFAVEDNNSAIVSDEIFGPVLSVIPFDDTEEAIRQANDSWAGLSATLWTKNIDLALRCIESIDAGWVFVNGPARSDPAFPIGGFKQSGIGKELGKVGLYAYTRVKSVNIIFNN